MISQMGHLIKRGSLYTEEQQTQKDPFLPRWALSLIYTVMVNIFEVLAFRVSGAVSKGLSVFAFSGSVCSDITHVSVYVLFG